MIIVVVDAAWAAAAAPPVGRLLCIDFDATLVIDHSRWWFTDIDGSPRNAYCCVDW